MKSTHEGFTPQERSLLRLGGIAGILAGVVFVFVPVLLFGFQPQAPAGSFRTEGGGQVDASALVALFPASRAVLALGNLIDFASSVLSLALILGLYVALRSGSLGPALLGSVLYVLGLGVLFTETATQVAFDPISSLYSAPGSTPGEQATLSLLWQATQGLFYELDAAAVLLISVATVVLGVAMYRSSIFGKSVSSFTQVLGCAGLTVIIGFGITSVAVAALLIPVFVVLPILLGWKVYRISKTV